VIVGAGIVGLATAHALLRAEPGLRLVVVDKERGPGRHQTGRNSGVVHSGIYYPPGSLKAEYALAGAAETPAFCAEHDVACEVTGKLVVATQDAELPRLEALARRGREHGIPVREIEGGRIAEWEPAVAGIAALHVGTTGICDFRGMAVALASLVAAAGGELAYGLRVTRIGRADDGRVTVATAPGGPALRTRVLVNCAGLYSDRLARLAGEDPGLRIVPFRGEFYELAPARRGLVRGLVYPVPDPAFPFLGVHLTRDVHGGVHVGPNAVPAAAREGYRRRTVRPRDLVETAGFPGTWRLARRHWRQEAGEVWRSLSKRAFAARARRLLPALRAEDLRPAPAGVRAQAVLPDGTLVDDFRFAGEPPIVHVLNAPSPAATAALPIGREIARRALAAL
jgi:L-2-hydroxyglutarate oxidase